MPQLQNKWSTSNKVMTVAALGLASVVIMVIALPNVEIDASKASGTIAPAQRVVTTQISNEDALNESAPTTASNHATDNAEGTLADKSVESSMEASMENAFLMRMQSAQSDDGGRDRHNGESGRTDPIIF